MRTFSQKGPDDGYISDGDDKQFESDRRFSNYILLAGAFSLGCLLLASNVQHARRDKERNQQNKDGQSASKTTYTGKAEIGGPWMLYNTKGEPVTHKDFEGKYYLIYFGFTFCPDVCPVSLQKMTKAANTVKSASDYKYFDLEQIFVSVDPDRDSYKRIEEYCKIFDPSLHGLTHKTNDNPDLKSILKSFKIHVSKIFLTDDEDKEDAETLKKNAPEVVEAMEKVKPKKEEKYTLDHSIVVYLMGPDNQFLTYLGSNLDEATMSEIVLDEIRADLKRRVS